VKTKNFFHIFVIFLSGVFAIFFIGCSAGKNTLPQETVFVIWRTPGMKYADQGFVYHEKNGVRLEIYSSGQAVMRLEVRPGEVCADVLCMSGKEFNLRYLSPAYPESLLADILNFRPVFGGVGMDKSDYGFTQKIEKENIYSIDYSVLDGSVVFRDTINRILIKIRKQG